MFLQFKKDLLYRLSRQKIVYIFWYLRKIKNMEANAKGVAISENNTTGTHCIMKTEWSSHSDFRKSKFLQNIMLWIYEETHHKQISNTSDSLPLEVLFVLKWKSIL